MSKMIEIKNIRDAEVLGEESDGKLVEKHEILSLKRMKWFSDKFERESAAVVKRYIGEKPKVEYLSGIEGVVICNDGSVTIDPDILRTRWGSWLRKKLQKEGKESVMKYLEERQRQCEAAKGVSVESRSERRKQHMRKIRATQTLDKDTGEKAEKSSTQQNKANGETNGAAKAKTPTTNNEDECIVSTNTTTAESATTTASPPGDRNNGNVDDSVSSPSSAKPADENSAKTETAVAASADSEVRVEPALLRSRWGQWMNQKLKNADHDDKVARIREGESKTTHVAEDTAEMRAKSRQQMAGENTEVTNSKHEDYIAETDKVADAKTRDVDIQNVAAASTDVQPQATKTSIPTYTSCKNDKTKPTSDHEASPGDDADVDDDGDNNDDDDGALDNVLLALYGHFGENCHLVAQDMRHRFTDEVVKQDSRGPYIGGAYTYTHAYDWIFGSVMSDAGRTH